jgi:hypothetical protein
VTHAHERALPAHVQKRKKILRNGLVPPAHRGGRASGATSERGGCGPSDRDRERAARFAKC